MWIVVVFAVLLIFGPTRRMLAGNWRLALPFCAGAAAGWELGLLVFGHHPALAWVPLAWALLLGFMAGKEGKQWLDQTLGDRQ